MGRIANPTLQLMTDKVDSILRLCGPGVQRDDGQAKGPMYKLGARRLCGLRPQAAHLSLLLFGLPADQPIPDGVTYSRTAGHLRVEVNTYDDVVRVASLLRRTYERAVG